MDLNTFTIDQLPFQTSEALPKDCTKHEIPMGAVPDETDETMPCSYMDEIFAAGGDSPVPPTPVGPKDNEIWYWGEYYDIENAINILSQQGIPYVGPVILSNEKVGDKYIITFDGSVAKLGLLAIEETGELYPLFMTNTYVGLTCNITSVKIPNSVTSIGNMAFYGCTGLASIEIPNSVTSIGNMAFAGCTGLASITIPDSVTSIEYMSFGGCAALPQIIIPNSVISIGVGAFTQCTSLSSIYYAGRIEDWNKIDFNHGSPFNETVPAKVVHCTDGDVDI